MDVEVQWDECGEEGNEDVKSGCVYNRVDPSLGGEKEKYGLSTARAACEGNASWRESEGSMREARASRPRAHIWVEGDKGGYESRLLWKPGSIVRDSGRGARRHGSCMAIDGVVSVRVEAAVMLVILAGVVKVKGRMIVACVIIWVLVRLSGQEVKVVVVLVMSGIVVGVVIVEVGEIVAWVVRRVVVRLSGQENLVGVVEAVAVVVVAVAVVEVVAVVVVSFRGCAQSGDSMWSRGMWSVRLITKQLVSAFVNGAKRRFWEIRSG